MHTHTNLTVFNLFQSKSYTILVIFLILSFFPINAMSATYNVNTVADENDGSCSDGDCSLRDAIILANANSGSDTISFSESMDGSVICLSLSGTGENNSATGDLDITDDISILGNGASKTIIDGGSTSIDSSTTCSTSLGDRVFDLLGTVGASYTFQDITIRGGESDSNSAGMKVNSNNSVVQIIGSVLTNNYLYENATINRGAALFVDNASTIEISTSRITNNKIYATSIAISGGGIAVRGGSSISIENSEISHNVLDHPTDARGAGVSVEQSSILIAKNSTFSNNTSNATGGLGQGGGLYVATGSTASLSNCTISKNSANTGGGIRVTTSTSEVNLSNTIIAENTSNSSTTKPNCALGSTISIQSYGYNLIDSTLDCTLDYTTSGADSNTDIRGESALLADLSDNGGYTHTHALNANSPAINAGSCIDVDGNTLASDQRPQTRTDSDCDIGAFESICGDKATSGSEECDEGTDPTEEQSSTCSSTCQTQSIYYLDADSDGFGDVNNYSYFDSEASTLTYADNQHTTDATDCDDSNASINTAATENCGDGIDNDCSGSDVTCDVVEDTSPNSDSTIDTAENTAENTEENTVENDDAEISATDTESDSDSNQSEAGQDSSDEALSTSSSSSGSGGCQLSTNSTAIHSNELFILFAIFMIGMIRFRSEKN